MLRAIKSIRTSWAGQHQRNEKYIQNFGQDMWRKETNWDT